MIRDFCERGSQAGTGYRGKQNVDAGKIVEELEGAGAGPLSAVLFGPLPCC